jgi:hypothetical protein
MSAKGHTHPEPPTSLLTPSVGELVDVDGWEIADEFPTPERREVFALAQVMRSTAYKIGAKTPLGEQVALKAVRLIYDAQNPGDEGRAG